MEENQLVSKDRETWKLNAIIPVFLYGASFTEQFVSLAAASSQVDSGWYAGGMILSLVGKCVYSWLFVVWKDARNAPTATRMQWAWLV